MARVTVEDCVLRVPNRFELVMMAGQRAREIAAGGALTVERDNDKNPVVALREIADGTVELDTVRESLIRGHQRVQETEEPEEEIIELMAGEEDWLRRGLQSDAATSASLAQDEGADGSETIGEADLTDVDSEGEDEAEEVIAEGGADDDL